MIIITIQRTKIHKTNTLPVPNLYFATKSFDFLSPANQWPGDASRTIFTKFLELAQQNAITISHEKRFIRHLYTGHYYPIIQLLTLTKHIEYIIEYINPTVYYNIILRLKHPLTFINDFNAHVFDQTINSGI